MKNVVWRGSANIISMTGWTSEAVLVRQRPEKLKANRPQPLCHLHKSSLSCSRQILCIVESLLGYFLTPPPPPNWLIDRKSGCGQCASAMWKQRMLGRKWGLLLAKMTVYLKHVPQLTVWARFHTVKRSCSTIKKLLWDLSISAFQLNKGTSTHNQNITGITGFHDSHHQDQRSHKTIRTFWEKLRMRLLA